MDKYFLFCGDSYYPEGGWHDFNGQFATLEEAQQKYMDNGSYDWAHVVLIKDTISEIVWTHLRKN